MVKADKSLPSILLVHPAGDTQNNPNLYGICQILGEKGYTIDVIIPKIRTPALSENPSPGVRFLEFGSVQNEIIHFVVKWIHIFGLTKVITTLFFSSYLKKKYDLIIGVDREGLVIAAILGNRTAAPIGMISYEILFAEENKKRFKKIEIECAKNLLFAVCQDELRASLLSVENHIPKDKIFKIPVAGRYRSSAYLRQSASFHDKLGIDRSKKIAFYAGSIAAWSMIPELISNLSVFPEDWVVVLHGRYGDTESMVSLLQKTFDVSNLYFSEEPVGTNDEMHRLLDAVDLGLAFYKPTYTCAYTGRNLKNIGMASGKIATYLQHGVPVLCNEIGEMSAYIKKHRVGFVVTEFSEISEVLKHFDKNDYYDRCIAFYREVLDLNKTIRSFNCFLESILPPL